MTIGIYVIKNIVNNKCYIGQSQNIETRIREHKYLLRNNKYGNLKIQTLGTNMEKTILYLKSLKSVQ